MEKCRWDKMGYSKENDAWYHVGCKNNDMNMLDPKGYPDEYDYCPFCGMEIESDIKF